MRALITGITGQDGSYLAEFLLKALGWKPEVDFHQLIKMMVESDLASLRQLQRSRAAAAGD